MFVSSNMSGGDGLADLVLVNDPAFVFFIPAVMAATVFDNLVDREVLQSSVGSQDITVTCLAHSGRTGDYDVRLCPRHVCCMQRVEKTLFKANLQLFAKPWAGAPN